MIISETVAEAALIEQAQNGDRHAYGELVRRHHAGVIRVVYRMCGDPALAEDAAQDAFIRAWLRLSSFRPGTSLRNWLYRIAVNAALDALRRDRKTADLEVETLSLPDPEQGPEAAVLQREREHAVREAIRTLPEAARSVLVLREYGGLSYKEIAAALDIPLGTVMSRLNYARSRLKERLHPNFTEREDD
ncbi:MAG TPA: sigma-70 family RNA polymerase sigma factor [Anaerolineales bacterium]|nr:sigma-70 family RNA polymerase sigma factor [Anaerolineales bacterium]